MKFMIDNNRTYDFLKYIAQIILPASGTLYFALSEVWGFGYGVEVIGTIAALDTFLGVILGISSSNYQKSDTRFNGFLDVVEHETGDKEFQLNFDGDPYLIDEHSELLFKVNPKKE